MADRPEEKMISRRKAVGLMITGGIASALMALKAGEIGTLFSATEEEGNDYTTSEEIYADIRIAGNGKWLGLTNYKAGDTMRIRDVVRDIGYSDGTTYLQLPEGRIYVFYIKPQNLPESSGIIKGDEIKMTVPVLGPDTGLEWYKGRFERLNKATEMFDFLDTKGEITVKKI